MANLGAKLKGIDYKQAALEHCEKIVLGVIVLFVLVSLVSARWKPEPRTPEELKRIVAESKAKVAASTWPDEDRQKFEPNDDIRTQVETMFTSLDVSRFRYSTEMSWPLYPKQEPIREPKNYLPIEDMIAEYGRVILSVRAKPVTQPDEGLPGGPLAQGKQNQPQKPADDIPDDFRRRGAGGPGAGLPGSEGALGLPGADDGQMLAGGAGDMMSSKQSGRGARYVTIRGVFPLREQLLLYARALNETLPEKISNLFDVVDFTLERQTAIAGADPWAGKWEPVNRDVAYEVLAQADDFDPDPVDPGVTHYVFTMPLPRRVVGVWSDRATHPRIKEFVLSPDEMEQMMSITEKVLEQFEKEKASLPPQPVKPGGFSDFQHNIPQMRRQVMYGPGQGSKRFMEQLSRELDTPQALREALTLKMQQADASGRLLLFRYLDFDVEPGNAYRYRVRLKLRNPNWNRPIEQVVDPTVVEGQTRDTEWSEPTNTVIVPEDAEIFLAQTTPARAAALPNAKFTVFQWQPDVGTLVKGDLITELGQFIGGTTKTELVNPAAETFKEEDVEFKTGDALVDVAERPSLVQADHPDLNLPVKGSRSWEAGTEQALVVNEFGELVSHDALSRKSVFTRQESRLTSQNNAFAYLKNKASGAMAGADGSLAGTAGQYGEMFYGGADPEGENAGGTRKRTRRGGNPSRKNNAAMPGMYPGAEGAGYP